MCHLKLFLAGILNSDLLCSCVWSRAVQGPEMLCDKESMKLWEGAAWVHEVLFPSVSHFVLRKPFLMPFCVEWMSGCHGLYPSNDILFERSSAVVLTSPVLKWFLSFMWAKLQTEHWHASSRCLPEYIALFQPEHSGGSLVVVPPYWSIKAHFTNDCWQNLLASEKARYKDETKTLYFVLGVLESHVQHQSESRRNDPYSSTTSPP